MKTPDCIPPSIRERLESIRQHEELDYCIRHTSMSIMNILKKEWSKVNGDGRLLYPTTIEDLDDTVEKTRELFAEVPSIRALNPMAVSIIDDYENIKCLYMQTLHYEKILTEKVGQFEKRIRIIEENSSRVDAIIKEHKLRDFSFANYSA